MTYSRLRAAVIAFITASLFSSTAFSMSANWQCDFPGEGPITYIADLSTGEGKATGALGSTTVSVYQGLAAISFIEPTPTGTVNLTTIVLKTGEASRSRNTVSSLMNGTFLATQVIGMCRPLQ